MKRLSRMVGFVAPILLLLFLISCGNGSTLTDAETRYSAGVEFQRDGRLEQAIAEWDEAIRLDSQYALPYVSRGNAYVDLEQFERAIQDFSDAIRINPDLTNAYAGRAVAYILLGKKEEAQPDIDRVVGPGLRNER